MAELSLKYLLYGVDKSASKVIEGVGKKAEQSGSRMRQSLGLGAAAAGAAVVAFGASSIEAFEDADEKQRKLQDAFDRFPKLADTNIGKLQDLATAVQHKTGADGDALNAAQASLASYGLTGKQIEQLTPLVADYAARTGKDIPTAAADLGKAMLGSGKALKAIGIDFKNTGSVGGNFDQVVAGLRTQVGGFAEKEGKTASGQAKILKENFGDIQETVGAKLVPVLARLAQAGIATLDWMTKHGTAVRNAAIGTGVLAGVIGVATLAVQLHGLAMGIAAAGGVMKFLAATRVGAAAQWLLNAALTANPIGLVVVAIAALAAGLIYAYQHSETFRAVVDAAFKAIATAGTWLWNTILQPVVQMMIKGFQTVASWVSTLLRALGQIPGFGWANDAANALDAAARKAGELANGIQKIPTTKHVTITFDSSGYSTIPGVISAAAASAGRNADGTDYWKGGLTWVGEEGPELLDLPGGTRIHSNRESAAMVAGRGTGRAAVQTGGPEGGVAVLTLDGRVVAQSQLRFARRTGQRIGS